MDNIKLSKMDLALIAGMGTCLITYIAGHFTGQPFPEMMDLMKWFGLGLGLGQLNK